MRGLPLQFLRKSATLLQVDLVIKSTFERNLAANTIVINIPVPPQTAKVTIKKSKGEAKYDGSAGIIRWSINKFSGQKQHSLSADVLLVSTTREKKAWNRYLLSLLLLCTL
jgi:AP-2 complex subunit mu-1